MDGDHRKAGVAGSAIPPRPANEGLVPRSPGTVGPLHSDSDGLERSAREVRLGGESSDRGTAYSRGGDRVRSMDRIARVISRLAVLLVVDLLTPKLHECKYVISTPREM